MALILASTSPYRRDLLIRLGLPFECMPSGINEDDFKEDGIGPVELSRTLATEKALAIVIDRPLATIIGCDQVVDVQGRILGKPETLEAAVDQLSLLQGRSHRLVTAVCVWHDGLLHTHVDITKLTMRPMNVETIAHYLAVDNPLDCAGSYKLESRGIALFDRIESDDHTAIIGLPLIALTTILKRCGYQIP